MGQGWPRWLDRDQGEVPPPRRSTEGDSPRIGSAPRWRFGEKHSDEVYGRSVRDEIHHPRGNNARPSTLDGALGLYFVLWRYPRPSVYGQGGLTPSPLSCHRLPAGCRHWLVDLLDTGRKDDKTTSERARDTNRGTKEGVKEARKDGRESISRRVRFRRLIATDSDQIA